MVSWVLKKGQMLDSSQKRTVGEQKTLSHKVQEDTALQTSHILVSQRESCTHLGGYRVLPIPTIVTRESMLFATLGR